MIFGNRAERMRHPQARLIPDALWIAPDSFDRKLPEEFLELMLAEGEDEVILALHDPSFSSMSSQDKECAWLCIALAHPSFSSILSLKIGTLLNLSVEKVAALAISIGSEAILNTILETSSESERHKIITGNDYQLFSTAAAFGQHSILELLIKNITHTDMNEMIRSCEYGVLECAVENGHLSIIDCLIKYFMSSDPEIVQSMISSDNFWPFRRAAEKGYLTLVKRFMDLYPYKTTEMILAFNHYAFRKAHEHAHLSVITHLMHFSSQFAYAELHDEDYQGLYVRPFIQAQLAQYRKRKAEAELQRPATLFDICDEDEAKLCFYMIRNLIRRNHPKWLEDIRFLMGIPAVNRLLATEVSPGQSNELLRLALLTNNQSAAALLLTIHDVDHLAAEHDYYRMEIRGGFDLKDQAIDSESSMRALSLGEQRRLKVAIERYQPVIEKETTDKIMKTLRLQLMSRYESHPASIIIKRDGVSSNLVLPFSWTDFSRLDLTEEERNKALEAYYKHKDHTAWRYLSIPNPWLHKEASYVYFDREKPSERWSDFEKYQPFICLLYLAVTDEEIPSTDGYTLESRLECFIHELAYIGRAHNWDKTRNKTNKYGKPLFDEAGNIITEEYDDLKGDRPSCFSGVKRRLFQSVQGHPYFKMLTKEVINDELYFFVRKHIKDLIQPSNREQIKEARDKWIQGETLSGIEWEVLQSLDITPKEKEQFVNELSKKYQEQFTEDEGFMKQVREAFEYKSAPDAHVLNFGHLHWEQFLFEPEDIPRLSELSFLGKTCRAGKSNLASPSLEKEEVSFLRESLI